MVSANEIKEVFCELEKTHLPTMLEELGHYTHFQMLVMTLLSARAKDSTVIPIVKEMFARYPKPEDYVHMDVGVLEGMIRRIGFFRVKARHVIALSGILLEKFNGVVPCTLDELTSLPGVGRKTANCMLNYAFGTPAVAVDIHVHRIANRLGWIVTKNEKESERELMRVVPREQWINVNRLLVGHGQTVCKPIGPMCGQCSVRELCEFGK